MSDLYKVGIHLAVSGNAGSFFSSLGAHLLGVHRSFGHVYDDIAKTEAGLARINRLKLAIGGGIAVMGGVELLKAAGHLETAGEKLVHAQTVLGAGLPAATRAASVLDATAEAWKEAGRNMNTTVTGNIEALHDLYNVVQDMDHAKGLLPAFNTLQATLSSVKDGASIGEAASAKNVASAVRAFELMGKTDPHALEGMSNDFTRTTIALRGRVDGQNFLTAVQGAGDSRYGWGNDFATKGFPAMVNAMGTRAGNLMNMLNNNLYGGVASSEIQAGYQIQYGLHNKKDLEANGKAFKPGTVYQAGLLRDNPIAWANKYREHLRELGLNVDDLKTMQDIVAKIGRGNRSVKAALDELLLPMTNRQINKEVTNIGKVGNDAADFLGQNDPKRWRDALSKQWENLETAIGLPLVQPVLDILKALTVTIKDLSQAAAANPGAAKMIAEGIVALGAALTTGGVAAIIAAIGPVGWIAAGITAIGAAVLKADPSFFSKLAKNYMQLFDDIKSANWGAIGKDILRLLNDGFLGLPAKFVGSQYFKTIVDDLKQLGGDLKNLNFTAAMKDVGKYLNDALAGLPALVAPAIADAFAKIGEAIKAAVANMLSGGILGGGKPAGEMPSGLPGMPSSYGGTGIDPALIHRSSLVGVANDNIGASGLKGQSGSRGISARDMRDVNLEMASYIRQSAIRNGIDPNVALRIANSEGLRGSIPGVRNTPGDKGTSFGPFQLHYASRIPGLTLGGLGDRYTKETGHHASDPKHWKEQIDFALRTARREGWGAWHGRIGAGIGKREGIGVPPVHQNPVPPVRQPPSGAQMVQVHTNVHMDGKRVAGIVSNHQAQASLFPRKAGGMDTHGSFRSPGTPVTDAA